MLITYGVLPVAPFNLPSFKHRNFNISLSPHFNIDALLISVGHSYLVLRLSGRIQAHTVDYYGSCIKLQRNIRTSGISVLAEYTRRFSYGGACEGESKFASIPLEQTLSIMTSTVGPLRQRHNEIP